MQKSRTERYDASSIADNASLDLRDAATCLLVLAKASPEPNRGRRENHMENCIRLILALALAGVAMSTSRAAAPAVRRPNLVVLLADDLGYADVGFQGCRDIPTPHIDSLARNGVRCTNGYVSGPYCSPTRAGLLTGRYQQRFGHEFNPSRANRAGDPIGLPLSEATIANRLQAAGYATGLVGKWHLGEMPQFQPPQRGFGEFFGFLIGAHPYFPGMGAPIYRGADPVIESEYLTDAFAREAVAFIDRHKAQPFFLYLAFNAVHTPLDATPKRLERFASIADTRRRTYAAMLSAMDDAVGRVLTTLRSAGLEEDTLIFFLSDNGGPTMKGTTINGSSNAPLRGSKRTTLEGGIRVPFVVQWKGRIPAGTVYENPLIQLDLLPTALAAAGVDPPADTKFDGVDLLPFLTGKKESAPHDTLYWRFGDQMALRKGDWKIVRYDSAADDGAAGIATPIKLYNLAKDIGEGHDVASARPEKVKELESLWQKWNGEMIAPLWGGTGK
jgi:arylsulfatase A-like enzyme